MYRSIRNVLWGVTVFSCAFAVAAFLASTPESMSTSGLVSALTPKKVTVRSATKPSPVKRTYVVNLASDTHPIDVKAVKQNPAFAGHRLYTTQVRIDGTLWHRLRLGNFPDKASARVALQQVAKAYPKAWIARETTGDAGTRSTNTVAKAPRADSRAKTTLAKAPRTDRGSATGSGPISSIEMAKARTAVKVAFRRMDAQKQAVPTRTASSSGGRLVKTARVESKVLSLPDNAVASECDELAAHPWDPQKIAKGRFWNEVPGERAVAACEAAVKSQSDPRNMFQYARALAKVKRYDEAAQWYSKAASLGYAQAQYAFGDIYEFGEGVLQNYAAAQKWYQRAADQGYEHASKRLTRMREAGYLDARQQMASADSATEGAARVR